MANTILIPTDFTIKSLTMVRDVVEQTKLNNINFILVHGVRPPSSTSELLFYSKRKLIETMTSPAFKSCCALIINRYPEKVSSIWPDILSTQHAAGFENYLDKVKPKETYIPSHALELPHERSFDVMSLLKKSSLKLNELAFSPSTDDLFVNQMEALFFSAKN
tara:strand:- start:4440 stop:4928 length:489 start_codon:yes stop_codon:yes gene_type:complete